MVHRSLVIRERITAIMGAALLLLLVGASYYYSIQIRFDGLKYVPSETSPDFTARNVTLTDFDERGVASRRLSASSMDHFSDERVKANNVRYFSLDPEKPQLSLIGDKAWSNDSLETIELSGDVTISRSATTKEPELFFQTEYLKGFLDTHRFETTKPVFMRRGIDTTTATGGMIYDNVTHSVELQEKVVSVFHPQRSASEDSAQADTK